jgi:hypothetical protein
MLQSREGQIMEQGMGVAKFESAEHWVETGVSLVTTSISVTSREPSFKLRNIAYTDATRVNKLLLDAALDILLVDKTLFAAHSSLHGEVLISEI